MDEVDKLTKSSHLSYGGAKSLLQTRTLSGDIEMYDYADIIVTEDTVVLVASEN